MLTKLMGLLERMVVAIEAIADAKQGTVKDCVCAKETPTLEADPIEPPVEAAVPEVDPMADLKQRADELGVQYTSRISEGGLRKRVEKAEAEARQAGLATAFGAPMATPSAPQSAPDTDLLGLNPVVPEGPRISRDGLRAALVALINKENTMAAQVKVRDVIIATLQNILGVAVLDDAADDEVLFGKVLTAVKKQVGAV